MRLAECMQGSVAWMHPELQLARMSRCDGSSEDTWAKRDSLKQGMLLTEVRVAADRHQHSGELRAAAMGRMKKSSRKKNLAFRTWDFRVDMCCLHDTTSTYCRSLPRVAVVGDLHPNRPQRIRTTITQDADNLPCSRFAHDTLQNIISYSDHIAWVLTTLRGSRKMCSI